MRNAASNRKMKKSKSSRIPSPDPQATDLKSKVSSSLESLKAALRSHTLPMSEKTAISSTEFMDFLASKLSSPWKSPKPEMNPLL
jgi:hypothetical protein